MDCGPACLRMVAAYYGRHYSLETLRRRSFITRQGVSMYGISTAARSVGLKAIGMKVSLESLTDAAQEPCILFWNQNHFVVFCGVRHRHGQIVYIVDDPACGKVRYNVADMMRFWANSSGSNGKRVGIALLLHPTPDFYSLPGEQKSMIGRDFYRYVKYLLPYRHEFIQLGLGMLAGSIIQAAFPFLTQTVVDRGINGQDLGLITLILIAQMVLFVTQLTVEALRSWISLYVNARIDISLISDFLSKLMRLPLSFFDTKVTGDLLQRIGDHGRIKSFLMGNSVNIVFSGLNFIVFACILAYYSLAVLCLFIVANTFYVIWISIFMRYRRELDIRRFNQSAGEQSSLIQIIQGMAEIKLNNCEKQKRWEWERIQARLFKISTKALAVGQIQQAGSVLFTRGSNILITFIAAKSVINGSMTLGMMMSMTYIVGQLSAPIGEFTGFITSLQDAKISLERLNEIHRQKDEESGISSKASSLPYNRCISFKRVSFSYDGADNDCALNDVSLDIPAGKFTAIVGSSGSGKTTIIKLLLGFYSPLKGSITIGGTPLDRINPHLWRGSTGAVMQEGFIFSDTIRRNIAVNGEDIDEQRLSDAVHTACLDDFISTLPMGLETKIGMDGCGISSGQKQRILIARAVYKNPEYFFFDEATNSLDTFNEMSIMKNLRKHFSGKTVLVVAHRLSTVYDADKIIVMDAGKVVETGTHDQLLRKEGYYYRLVKSQVKIS